MFFHLDYGHLPVGFFPWYISNRWKNFCPIWHWGTRRYRHFTVCCRLVPPGPPNSVLVHRPVRLRYPASARRLPPKISSPVQCLPSLTTWISCASSERRQGKSCVKLPLLWWDKSRSSWENINAWCLTWIRSRPNWGKIYKRRVSEREGSFRHEMKDIIRF